MMTRINIIPVQELTDQHLVAEYKEITQVRAVLVRHLKTKVASTILPSIPKEFCLNTGHMRFFYDKMQYLAERFYALYIELRSRGYLTDESGFSARNNLFYDLEHTPFWHNYEPTEEALTEVRERIRERIAQKPFWYTYHKVPLTDPACTYTGTWK